MSFLVELPLELYNPHAFAAFKPIAPYDLGTARALMWLSQLAYETAHPDKIARICQLWGLAQPRVDGVEDELLRRLAALAGSLRDGLGQPGR